MKRAAAVALAIATSVLAPACEREKATAPIPRPSEAPLVPREALFGDAEKELPYVECSTPDGNEQLQVCQDKNIESYPTWIFSDDSRLVGEVTLQELSQKTSCVLPPGA